jgi:hypothetical protein
MSDVRKTLEDRGRVHGEFADVAEISQMLKGIIWANHCDNLAVEQKEALDLICTKIARIVCGDPNHIDHWHDIAGYAMLVERRLKEKNND